MKDDYRTGVISVLACQLIWGFCPIYWQALEPIPSWIIILYRIVTMFIFSYIELCKVFLYTAREYILSA